MIGAITGVLASRNASATVEQYYTTAIYPILAPNDSAAVFVPDIISGELAQYYTSVLYPVIFEDAATTGVVSIDRSELWSYPEEQLFQSTPTLVSGTLQETIVYKTYNDGLPEEISQGTAVLLSGTLQETIVYKIYNDGLPEELIQDTPTLQSGTLETTISYITYNNGVIEELTQSTPSIVSGTLT